jgi:exodeoxyribonuclease VII small subunit
MKTPMERKTPNTFEDALIQLQDAVSRLETGNLPLEETLALFEEGQELAVLCNHFLDQAQLRLEQLGKDGTLSQVEVDSDTS